jgi:hypothetical protein
MQTTEMYFNDTTEKYRYFNEAASLLTRDIPSLSAIEIERRCTGLTTLQRELTDNNDQLCLIMESMGSEILDTSYIGELQRAIDKSVIASDSLRAELLLYRNNLYLLSGEVSLALDGAIDLFNKIQ